MSQQYNNMMSSGNIPEKHQVSRPMLIDTYNSHSLNDDFSLRFILNIIIRWWWLILLAVTICASLSAVILTRLDSVYRSSTLIEVKQEERNIIDMSEVERVSVNQMFLSTQVELLKSGSLAERVINSMQLTSDPYFHGGDKQAWENMTEALKRRAIIGQFKNNLNITPVGQSLLIRVSFDHTNPQKAAQIANNISQTFISDGLGRKISSNGFARNFLQEQLVSIRATLESAERSLADYARDNSLVLVNDTDSASNSDESLDMGSLITLNKELTKASIERAASEAAYRQAQQSSFTDEILNNEGVSSLTAKLVDLRSEYQENLALYKPKWPSMLQMQSRIDLIEEEIEKQTSQIVNSKEEVIRQNYELALARENNLKAEVDDLKKSVVNIRDKSIDYNILRRQVEIERSQYEAILQRLKEVSVSDNLESDLVQIVDRAQPSRIPQRPNRKRAFLVVILISSFFAFILAYLLEFFDDRIKKPDDVKRKTNQVLMGVIPKLDGDKDIFPLLMEHGSDIAEAYASLRTNIQFSGSDGGPKVIQVTSTCAGEGKSVTSLGLSLRFASIGKRVLLVDADMRLPTFRVNDNSSRGLARVLSDSLEFSDEIYPSMHENLFLLPVGHIVPNPSELLSSERFASFLDYARQNYDYVIVDSPPLLGMADAPVIGARVDGTIMVTQAGLLRTANVLIATDRLQASGTKILGFVLTKYVHPMTSYGGNYQYSYADKSGSKRKDGKRAKTENAKQKRKFDIV